MREPKKIRFILNEILEKITPEKEDLEFMKNYVKDFKSQTEVKIRKLKIDAEIFVGGSFSKETVMKKDVYDADIFIRFDKKHSKEFSKLMKRIFIGTKNLELIHGSRDYFRVKVKDNFFLELVPVLKVKTPKEAENITDLSYLHVKYLNKKIKSKKILDEIKLAKAFCYANGTYGAESYINGFSGYALELLTIYYGGLFNLIKNLDKENKEKIIVDMEKLYKNKPQVLMDLNASKLESPVILIDPTYKQRNALAALSDETFDKFKKSCKKFLKNPSVKSFEIEKIDLKKVKLGANKKGYEFIEMKISTNKQVGDIAGSKLLKFYNHLSEEIGKYFIIKNKGFGYGKGKCAKCFFVVKAKKEIILNGPFVDDVKNVKKFEKEQRDMFVKGKKIYSREKVNFSLKEFLVSWKVKNKKKIKSMYVNGFDII
ncbi:hypothetical protein HOD29_02105 [archaeon]|jgi:tRNA nucleotidyltransferase (CCA-adding enzyme)|nr:hypothetical protein [archaeon]